MTFGQSFRYWIKHLALCTRAELEFVRLDDESPMEKAIAAEHLLRSLDEIEEAT